MSYGCPGVDVPLPRLSLILYHPRRPSGLCLTANRLDIQPMMPDQQRASMFIIVYNNISMPSTVNTRALANKGKGNVHHVVL